MVFEIFDKSEWLFFRKRKQHLWTAAVKYLSMNESRVRQEVKTIDEEECNVWRWIDVSVVLLCIYCISTPFEFVETQQPDG